MRKLTKGNRNSSVLARRWCFSLVFHLFWLSLNPELRPFFEEIVKQKKHNQTVFAKFSVFKWWKNRVHISYFQQLWLKINVSFFSSSHFLIKIGLHIQIQWVFGCGGGVCLWVWVWLCVCVCVVGWWVSSHVWYFRCGIGMQHVVFVIYPGLIQLCNNN